MMISNRNMVPVEELKKHTESVLNRIEETRKPLFISQDETVKAVLMGIQEYEDLEEAWALLKRLV